MKTRFCTRCRCERPSDSFVKLPRSDGRLMPMCGVCAKNQELVQDPEGLREVVQRESAERAERAKAWAAEMVKRQKEKRACT